MSSSKRRHQSRWTDKQRTVVALLISNLEYGGAQRQLVALANNLPENDYEVHVVSMSEFVPLAEDLKSSANRFHILPKKRKYDVGLVWRLSLLLRNLKVDVVHGFLFDAEIAGRVASQIAGVKRFIGSERNSDYVIKKNQRIAYKLTKYFRYHCIANSSAGAKFNAAELGYPQSHYTSVRNSVDLERFKPGRSESVRLELGISESDFLIGMFAAFKTQKNHIQLLRAIRILKEQSRNLRVLLVGDILHGGAQDTGSYYENVRQTMREFDISDLCILIGNLDNVEDYYRACDLTVLPSLFEGTPNVVLESMACGVAPVVTDVSDNRIIVKDGKTGFVVSVDDHEELASQIATCQQDLEFCRELGRAARRDAEERFSPAKLARETAAVYRRVLESCQG